MKVCVCVVHILPWSSAHLSQSRCALTEYIGGVQRINSDLCVTLSEVPIIPVINMDFTQKQICFVKQMKYFIEVTYFYTKSIMSIKIECNYDFLVDKPKLCSLIMRILRSNFLKIIYICLLAMSRLLAHLWWFDALEPILLCYSHQFILVRLHNINKTASSL